MAQPRILRRNAPSLNIEMERGTTLNLLFVVLQDDGTIVDLEGTDFRLILRTTTSTIEEDAFLILSTVDSSMSYDLETATVTAVFTAATTASYTFHRMRYDFEIIDSAGETSRLLTGLFILLR